ncbi:MAG: hypothetical protein R3232_02105 [Clostridia bacterium]|nr:hypothetical protein [Clostridia bacterium]
MERETEMNINDLNNLNEPMYIEDIDTPVFDYLKRPLVTKSYTLQPLGNEHFLDLFEFRLQNEPLESDPFDKIGEKFEDAYTQFFTYMCNIDNLAWVLIDRIYIVGFFLLEMDVDYNNYMNRNAHLYYELSHALDDTDIHVECIKAIKNQLFGESDIPRIELHLDNSDDDKTCMEALDILGFIKDPHKDPELGQRYYLINDDPILSAPPRHMPFIIKAYQDVKTKSKGNNHPLPS